MPTVINHPEHEEAAAELDFAEVYDAAQKASVDPELMAGNIARLMRETLSVSALDCAAGTGIPALYLRKLGVDVDCSDGDTSMISQFRINAAAMKVSSRCDYALWEDLTHFGKQYDYVMCQGNSLVYDHSWAGGTHTEYLSTIRNVFKNLAAVTKPGGWLHIDGPKDTHGVPFASRTAHNSNLENMQIRLRNGHAVDLSLTEVVHEYAAVRLWDCSVRLRYSDHRPPRLYSFVRYSSKLALPDFKPMLAAAGFEDIKTFHLPGSRDNHDTILARKT